MVRPLSSPHPFGEIALRGLDQEMIVIAHETVGMAEPVKALNHRLQRHQAGGAIGIVFINNLASVAPGRDAVVRARVRCKDVLPLRQGIPMEFMVREMAL